MSTFMDIKKELHLIITALQTSKWTVNFNYEKTITKYLKIISLRSRLLQIDLWLSKWSLSFSFCAANKNFKRNMQEIGSLHVQQLKHMQVLSVTFSSINFLDF